MSSIEELIFEKANDSVLKSIISVTSSAWQTLLLKQNKYQKRQYKGIFSLIVEKTLTFASSTNLVRKVKNMFPNFKKNCVMMF